jgi:hypothetical protein
MSYNRLKSLFTTVAVTAGAAYFYMVDPGLAGPQDDTDVVAQACAAPGPLLVLDSFYHAQPDYGVRAENAVLLDVNGDGAADISHGEMVAQVARQSGKPVATYGVASDVPGISDAQDVLTALRDIRNRVRQGTMARPAAIILSMEIALSIDALNDQLQARKDRHSLVDYTPSNVGADKEQLAMDIIAVSDSPLERNLYDIFHELRADDMPVIAAAGNDYQAGIINIFGALGAVSVGALTHDRMGYASYGNVNSLTTIYRVGDYISRRVSGGVDINNDGFADFTADSLTGRRNLSLSYNGLRPQYVSALHDVFRETLNRGATPETATQAVRFYGRYRGAGPTLFLRVGTDGTLRFDPANDGDPRQVALTRGTSFAAPAICNR